MRYDTIAKADSTAGFACATRTRTGHHASHRHHSTLHTTQPRPLHNCWLATITTHARPHRNTPTPTPARTQNADPHRHCRTDLSPHAAAASLQAPPRMCGSSGHTPKTRRVHHRLATAGHPTCRSCKPLPLRPTISCGNPVTWPLHHCVLARRDIYYTMSLDCRSIPHLPRCRAAPEQHARPLRPCRAARDQSTANAAARRRQANGGKPIMMVGCPSDACGKHLQRRPLDRAAERQSRRDLEAEGRPDAEAWAGL